jgi:hypothetical protein
MQHAPWMIYLQTIVFAIATILNVMIAREAPLRTWEQAASVVLFAALTFYQIYQWPIWS